MINIAILISGRGSNMEAILSAIQDGKVKNARPSIVISNKPDAAGLKIASEKYGIPVAIVQSKDAKGWEYDKKIIATLQEYDVNPQNGLVCLAGYMKIISAEFVRQYRMRIINIHPALLPSFPGLHAQKQALDYGVKVSGCTVHFVDEGTDTGPIILQKTVEVREDDSEEALAARILEQEHLLYPEAVRLFAEDRIRVDGRKVSLI